MRTTDALLLCMWCTAICWVNHWVLTLERVQPHFDCAGQMFARTMLSDRHKIGLFVELCGIELVGWVMSGWWMLELVDC